MIYVILSNFISYIKIRCPEDPLDILVQEELLVQLGLVAQLDLLVQQGLRAQSVKPALLVRLDLQGKVLHGEVIITLIQYIM